MDVDAVQLAAWRAEAGPAGKPATVPPPRSPTSGLVLVAEWGWGEAPAVAAAYEALRSGVAAAGAGALYAYPAHATHVTVATLSSFKKPDAPRCGLSAQDDAELVAAWGQALEEQLGGGGSGSGSDSAACCFELEAYRLELSPGAAFVHFRDPTGAMDRLRACVARARDENPALRTWDERLGGRVRGAVHLPDIVHASFARFVRADPSGGTKGGAKGDPSRDGGSGTGGSGTGGSGTGGSGTGGSGTGGSGTGGSGTGGSGTGDVVERFGQFASTFEPFKVRVARLTLANECSPYMHQGRSEGTVREFRLL